MSYAEWNPTTTYVQNDLVSYQGSIFVSLQTPNYNHNPSTATTYWAVQGGGGGVSKITAGTGITITPTGGIGNVTINATGGGGGVASITAGNLGIGIDGTPTDPVIYNNGVLSVGVNSTLAISGTPANPVLGLASPPQMWTLFSQLPSSTYAPGQFIFTYPVSVSPTKVIPVYVQVTFTSMLGTPIGDSFVAMDPNNHIPTGPEWNSANYINPPNLSPPSGSVFTFTYQFMIPPGPAGSTKTIQGLWLNSGNCTCSSILYVFQ